MLKCIALLLGCLLASPAFANVDIELAQVSTLDTRYYSYSFGDVRVNSSRWADFNFNNRGPEAVKIDRIDLWGQFFHGQTNCPAVLAAGAACRVSVEFRPVFDGYTTGRLSFLTSSGDVVIDLSGWGRRY